MSRYLLLILLNLPLIIAGMVSALVDYKLKKLPRRKFVVQLSVWAVILAGLLAAEPIYQFLFSNQLTETEPLSLFDVMQITGIITILFMANRSRIKVERLERRVQDLHQELSIKLSKND